MEPSEMHTFDSVVISDLSDVSYTGLPLHEQPLPYSLSKAAAATNCKNIPLGQEYKNVLNEWVYIKMRVLF